MNKPSEVVSVGRALREKRIKDWLRALYQTNRLRWRYQVSQVFKSKTTRAAFAQAMQNKTRYIPQSPQGAGTVSSKMIGAWVRLGWVKTNERGVYVLTVTGANMYLFWCREYGERKELVA
jgi:hypothetical protein